MPSDVAVHEPRTRVVGIEHNDGVSRRWKHGYVAARRVGEVGGRGIGIEGSGALGEDVEIVAMEMDWYEERWVLGGGDLREGRLG